MQFAAIRREAGMAFKERKRETACILIDFCINFMSQLWIMFPLTFSCATSLLRMQSFIAAPQSMSWAVRLATMFAFVFQFPLLFIIQDKRRSKCHKTVFRSLSTLNVHDSLSGLLCIANCFVTIFTRVGREMFFHFHTRKNIFRS